MSLRYSFWHWNRLDYFRCRFPLLFVVFLLSFCWWTQKDDISHYFILFTPFFSTAFSLSVRMPSRVSAIEATHKGWVTVPDSAYGGSSTATIEEGENGLTFSSKLRMADFGTFSRRAFSAVKLDVREPCPFVLFGYSSFSSFFVFLSVPFLSFSCVFVFPLSFTSNWFSAPFVSLLSSLTYFALCALIIPLSSCFYFPIASSFELRRTLTSSAAWSLLADSKFALQQRIRRRNWAKVVATVFTKLGRMLTSLLFLLPRRCEQLRWPSRTSIKRASLLTQISGKFRWA